jgi:hypothetical protein
MGQLRGEDGGGQQHGGTEVHQHPLHLKQQQVETSIEELLGGGGHLKGLDESTCNPSSWGEG